MFRALDGSQKSTAVAAGLIAVVVAMGLGLLLGDGFFRAVGTGLAIGAGVTIGTYLFGRFDD